VDAGRKGEITMGSELQSNRTMRGAAAMSGGQGGGADVLGIQGRNLDALAKAQRAFVEGFGALAERQSDMAWAAVRGAQALLAPMPFGTGLRAGVERRIDALKAALLDGTAGSNLLAETAARANAEVACILQGRTLAALDEFKAVLVAGLPPGGSAIAASSRPGRLAPADA